MLSENDKHIKLDRNHGKTEFYKVINRLFAEVKGKRYEYLFKLDDDLRLVDNFFERAIATWKSIPSKHKLAMNLMVDSRTKKSSWNGIKPKKRGDLWESGWIDMIWMAERGFIEHFNCELPPTYFQDKKERGFWEEYPERSSQVGKWLTLSFWQEERFWGVSETLVKHGQHESKLNPNERKRNPLET